MRNSTAATIQPSSSHHQPCANRLNSHAVHNLPSRKFFSNLSLSYRIRLVCYRIDHHDSVQLYPVLQSLLVKLVGDLQSLHNARRHVQDTCRAAVDAPYPEKRMISKLPHPHQNIPCHREVEELPSERGVARCEFMPICLSLSADRYVSSWG